MIQLVATPERYDGRCVRVMGFLRLEFEGNALYLHREDYEQGLGKNGVWVDIDRRAAEDRRLDRKYVLVEGTFDARGKGHMGLWSGTITDIKRVDLWGPHREPKR